MVALISFINYLPPDSALYTEMHPDDEFGIWNTRAKTNAMIADFIDAFVAAHTKKGKKANTYPRPKKKQRIGSGAIPISEFWDWWNKAE